MFRWTGWIWPGALTVAALSALAIATVTQKIEQNLATGLRAALAQADQEWANVQLDGRDAKISGLAPGEQQQSQATAAALSTRGVRTVLDDTVLMPLQSPYQFSARRGSNTLVLTGFLPDTGTQEYLLGETKRLFPAANIENNMEFARAAPENFAAFAAFGLQSLSKLSLGEIDLVGSRVSISGESSERVQFDAINAILNGERPPGLVIESRVIAPPVESPYRFSSQIHDNQISLEGFVPTQRDKLWLMTQAAKLFPRHNISEKLLLGRGEPKKYPSFVEYALRVLAGFSNGSVELVDRKLSIAGTAADSDVYDVLRLGQGTPKDIELSSLNIRPPTVDPYEWRIVSDGSGFTMEGFAPADAIRKLLGERIADSKRGLTAINHLKIAAGAPTGFVNFVDKAIEIALNLEYGRIALKEKNLSITGKARSTEAYRILQSQLKPLKEDFGDNLQLALAPPAARGDYQWAASKRQGVVVLKGSAPDAVTRGEIYAAASAIFADDRIKDEIVLETGAKAGFLEAIRRGLPLLSQLSTGELSLTNGQMSLRGSASSVLAYEQLTSLTSRPPGHGFKWDVRSILPAVVKPYIWGASYTPQRVAMRGFVPDAATAESLLDRIAPAEERQLSGKWRVASGDPPAFRKAAGVVADTLSRIGNGEGSLVDMVVSFAAEAASEKEAIEIERRMRAELPSAYTPRLRISYPLPPAKLTLMPVPVAAKEEVTSSVTELIPQPAEGPVSELRSAAVPDNQLKEEPNTCATDFNSLLHGAKIIFATDGAAIESESFPVLQQIAAGMLECTAATVEIAGHTATDGSEQENLDLSEARARAVTSYLVEAGVPASQIVAKGYGNERPLVEHTATGSRAINRRIEFRIIATN